MSRYILASDIHCRASRPQYRIDNYENSILTKVDFIVDTANKYNADIILAGDIFDNIRVHTRIINKVIRAFKRCKNYIYAVPGQHDMEHHGEDLLPSPYLTLIESEVIIDVSGQCIDRVCGIKWEGEFFIDAEKICDKSILVIHHTVTPKEPPFFLSDAISAEDVMKMYPQFKFIVCGDYHSPFVKKSKDQLLINCGCIGRSNKDQYDFQPQIYLLDTDVKKFKIIPVPIRPPEEVFHIPKETKADDSKLSEHISNIIALTKTESKPNFITTVKIIMKDEEFNDNQRSLAIKYYDEVRSA